MPSLIFGRSAYKRDFGQLPEIRLVNLFPEATPTAETGVVLQSRKGLTSFATRGGGPINGIAAWEGVFDGAQFTLAGNSLYRDATFLGTVNGSGPVRWAASDTEVVLTRGGDAYSYNGTNLAALVFPDSADVVSVDYIAGLFVFGREDTHQFYWSSVLDARTIDGIDFASAELKPDNILDVRSVLGTIYFLGQASIEAWFPSGNVDLPFTRIDQRLFSKGVIATGCVEVMNDTLIFVANDAAVYRLGDGLEKISHHGIEERITASTTVSAYHFDYEGHSHFCVRLDENTFAFDVVTGEWCEFATYQRDNFRPKCATNVGPIPYFGDDETNNIWEFSDIFKDDGDDLEGYFTALLGIPGGTVPFDSVQVMANVGHTDPLSGDDANPVMEMRVSRDAGGTFSAWRSAPLGAQGKYRNRAIWRRCGIFDAPGAVLEFRVTDQSPRRISSVSYNEPGGGRSR